MEVANFCASMNTLTDQDGENVLNSISVFQLNCRKALDKLTEWIVAAGQMNPHLPSGDALLAHWFRMLNDFKQHLPLLHKLSSDALKVKNI